MRAYKDNKIGRDQFKRAVAALERQMDAELDQARRDSRAGKIDRREYKKRVEAIEATYRQSRPRLD